MVELEVSPRDCALAISIPLTFDAFVNDIASPVKDFAKQLIVGSSPDQAWATAYRPQVVEPVERIVERLRRLGSNVLEQSTLADIADLSRQFPVIALLTHFKMSSISAADVLDPPHCLKIIRTGANAGGRALRSRAPQGFLNSLESSGVPHWEQAGRLASFLQSCVAPTHEHYSALPSRGRLLDPKLNTQALHRVILERSFGPALRPAACVETFDGLQTFDAFDAAIPRDFAGVLDLSTCNSFMIVEDLRRTRPHCLMVENRFLATPDFRLARHALVISQLSNHRLRYTDAVFRVHNALLEQETRSEGALAKLWARTRKR